MFSVHNSVDLVIVLGFINWSITSIGKACSMANLPSISNLTYWFMLKIDQLDPIIRNTLQSPCWKECIFMFKFSFIFDFSMFFPQVLWSKVIKFITKTHNNFVVKQFYFHCFQIFIYFCFKDQNRTSLQFLRCYCSVLFYIVNNKRLKDLL